MESRLVASLLLLLGGCVHAPAAPRVPPQPQEPTPPPDRALYQYLVASVAPDPSASEAALNTALLHDPGSPWLWIALADASRDHGGPAAQELARAQKAVALDPSLGAAHLALARAQLRSGDPAAASTSFERAVTLDPSLGDAWAEWCASLADRQDPRLPDAVAGWSRAPLTTPDALRARGLARLHTGDAVGAVSDLGRALPSFPDDTALLQAYEAAARQAGLLRTGMRLLEQLPASPAVLEARARLAWASDDPLRLAHASRLRAAWEGCAGGWAVVEALAWSEAGGHAAAHQALARAACDDTPDAMAARAEATARVLAAEGRLRAALAAAPPSAETVRAEILLALQQDRAALALAEAALRRDSAEVDPALAEAGLQAAARLGDVAAARAFAARLPAPTPEAARRQDARALALCGQRQRALDSLQRGGALAEDESWLLLAELVPGPDALATRERGVEALPSSAALWAALADARDHTGDPRAREAMELALLLDPGLPATAAALAQRLPPEQALAVVDAALERHPADVALLHAAIPVYVAAGDTDNAARAKARLLNYTAYPAVSVSLSPVALTSVQPALFAPPSP